MFRYILFLFFLLVAAAAHAQEQRVNRFSLNVSNMPVETFVQQVEMLSDTRFFFDTADVKDVFITVNVVNETVRFILDKAFAGTGLLYSIDRQNNVFITKKYQIQTKLAPAFYGSNLPAEKTAPAVIPEFSSAKKIQKTVTAEAKLYEIGSKSNSGKPIAVMNGYVRNSKTGEPLIQASVFIEKLQRGANTDQYGYYSISAPPGSYTISVQSLGMKDARYRIELHSDGRFDIDMAEQVVTLKEVVVSTQKAGNVSRVQMGVERLNIATIKKVPTIFGETDVLKVVTTLPGVKTVGEASSGFNVRGGSADQNLILFNDNTIYNPSHFFGMFSAFNPEIIKDIELYKSSIPAKYGGRLASVLDITTRDGNKKKFTGSAGLGLITSRINVEGPLVKDRTSFIFGARTTYANWLLQFLPEDLKNSKASFYDLNLTINHKINNNNDLYVSAYASNDRFNLANDTTYGYSNKSVSVKWRHSFSSKLNGFLTAAYDRYDYKVSSDKNKVNAYQLKFGISQMNLKGDLVYVLNPEHTLELGGSSIYYQLNPGSFTPVGNQSQVAAKQIQQEQALESAVYLADRYTINNRLSVHAGLRFSMFHYLGPGSVNQYPDGVNKTEDNIVGVKQYGNNKVIKTYGGPEYRVSVRYAINNSFSVKAGYNSQRQYIHMLSNTTAIAPTDIWKLSDTYIRPQRGQQWSMGFYKNFRSNTIETSVEFYYKTISDYLDYKPGATLILNDHIETDVINTKGKAYGVELMVKKQVGKLNGWISYTYSRVLLRDDEGVNNIKINRGEYYPANYDKPHDVTLVGNFKVNHRFSLSLNVNYSTGRPITLPVGRFYYAGAERVLYSDRNAYRIPDYFRADFAMNIDGNHKVKQKLHTSWTIGIYNLTGRKNPYSVYYVTENGRINGYKLSIFGAMIPFVNLNVRF